MSEFELEQEGKIHVITGFGKYKSSGAFGTVLRAINQGWRILIVQFLKGQKSGEIEIFEKYFPEYVTVMRYGVDKIVLPNNIEALDKEETQRGWQDMIEELGGHTYNLLVIDEVLPALDLKLLTQKQFFDFLSEKDDKLEVICTGRVTDKELMGKLTLKANLHSDIHCKRHYWQKKCPSCKRSWEYHYTYCPNCATELNKSRVAKRGIEL